MDAAAESFRESILAHARLVASGEAQLRYEADVPIANVPAELICVYTDDYRPDSKLMRAAFTHRKLEKLAEFNDWLCRAAYAFDRARVREVRDILKLPEWKSAMAFAQQLVANFEERNR